MLNKGEILCFGELLWNMQAMQTLPAGGPMNIGFHLNQLGFKVAIASCVDSDQTGDELLYFLDQTGINTDLVQRHPANPDHKLDVTFDEKKQVQYIRQAATAWDGIDLDAQLVLEVKHAQAIVFGTPSLKSKKTEDTLFELIDYGLTKIMDIHFDKKITNQGVIELLLKKSDIVKVNESDFTILTDWYNLTGTLQERMMLLYKKLELEILVVSGGGCKAYVVENNIFYEHHGFGVEITDPAGAEDAFFAGFIAAWFEGKNIEIALSEACAIGAFVATKYGASPKYKKSEIGMA